MPLVYLLMSEYNQDVPFSSGATIGDAWFDGFSKLLSDDLTDRHLTFHIADPLDIDDGIPVTTDLDDWRPTLNLGDLYDEYASFDFENETDYEGRTGRDWVDSRIYELFEGLYEDRLTNPDQVGMITKRLQEGNHGSCTNALVAQVYDIKKDLTVATSGRPFAKDMSCLTQLQFRPKRDHLHLFATFRSQYLDTKAYGNLISLAMLLAQVCAKADYAPGVLVERVNNTICMNRSRAEDLHDRLLGSKRSDRHRVTV